MIKMLTRRAKRHVELCTDLAELWVDPVLRLEQVSSTEASLLLCLSGDASAVGADTTDDSKSDFTSDTRYSLSSYVSNMSLHSNTSGTSTVSILSGASDISVASAFSVEGLDHSILSRGKEIVRTKKSGEEKKKKKYKSNREKRGEGRTESRDVWGLRREVTLCDSLIRLANVSEVVASVVSLCDALIYVDGDRSDSGVSSNMTLASQLQEEMDRYAHVVSMYTQSLA